MGVFLKNAQRLPQAPAAYSGKVVELRKKGYLSKVNLRCMKKIVTFLLAMMVVAISLGAKDMDSLLPVRGFAIEAPSVRDVDLFVRFIKILVMCFALGLCDCHITTTINVLVPTLYISTNTISFCLVNVNDILVPIFFLFQSRNVGTNIEL